ncbi:transposase [Oligosphaera ethanolica]|uniref:transposase n=1 Tax=Oligosphaera ethanolica TaxID=760260 RepID=UPI0027D81D17|nr:transposase [Oligosphaera ethanolica]
MAEVVYDHFHVIKLVNDAIDDIRRSVQNDLDKENAKYLKGKRYLPLRNQEDLNNAEKTELAELLVVSEELHAAWRIKELLRGIYELADDPDEARDMLTAWADICLSSASPELEKLGRTVQRHLDGICAYWSCGRISNAAMEGFNNKVRHMIAQAYGFHDYEYMKLKIYELPSMVLRKQLLRSCA